MMTSVSMFAFISGAAVPVTVVNLCMRLPELTRIGDTAGNRRRRGHGRTREVGPGVGTLPPDEVTVGRGHGTLPRRNGIAVDACTHRTPSLAPLKPSIQENLVDSFTLSRPLRGF